MKAFELEC